MREIWIVLPMEAGQELREVLYHLRNDRWTCAGSRTCCRSSCWAIGSATSWACPPSSSTPLPAARGRPEAFDRVALCALIGLSPVMLTVAALVKLSSRGPVLFTQPRLGVDGKVFRVYKFRTMTVHQEHGVVTQATGAMRV